MSEGWKSIVGFIMAHCTQVGQVPYAPVDLSGAGAKSRAPQHAHHVLWDQVPPGEKTQQRALADAVGAQKQTACAARKRQRQLLEDGVRRAWICEGQAVGLNSDGKPSRIVSRRKEWIS